MINNKNYEINNMNQMNRLKLREMNKKLNMMTIMNK